jgi:acyl-homoserine lactone acylase PvdQ
MKRVLLTGVALVTVLGVTAPVHADTGAYGKDDGGGFRNVLPPGQNGLDTLADIFTFRSNGTLPKHWDDQQPLYDGLIQAAPTLTDSQVGDFFKDATFGVKKKDRASVVKPRKGVTIIRDKQYGVPRVYGKTRQDTMFGAGYVSANDRLFLMDVLRHTGRADLSSFLGGANLNADANQWQNNAYTEEDLKRQLKAPAQGSMKEWKKLRKDVDAYVDGINAYIKAARKDGRLMPGEYTALGAKLKNWKATDVMATATLFGGIFGRGGGGEVLSAQILRALEARFGQEQGRAIWSGFRSKNNPTAPTTIPGSFPYQDGDAFATKGLALPDPGTAVTPAKIISGSNLAQVQSAQDGVSIGDALQQEQLDGHHSNWELLSAQNSANGRPIGVMGPQVGYYLPQVLMELELHGPGIDARGAAFPGVSMYVQLGRGRDYAWSATSAGSDNVDTFAEVLCGGSKYKYTYKGKCRPMEKLVRKLSWKPNAADPTPAGKAKLTVYRTVHGLVTHYGTVNGKQVAYVTARTTYMHEADSILGFRRFNTPETMQTPKQFHKSASKIQFTFNWAYQNAKQTAYYLSGAYPERAKGTSPDFPVLSTYAWQGFDAKNYTMDLLPFTKHPRTVDQPVMVSWNNKPAKDWAAADEQWGYGPFYRSNLIEEKLQAAVAGGKKATLAQVVQAMEESATQDIRGVKLLPAVIEAMGTVADPELASAIDTLRAWMADGSHRRDLDKDGAFEHTLALQIVDAWWPLLLTAQFEPGLGEEAFDAIQKMIGFGAATRTRPNAPQFSDGWWTYSLQDLQRVSSGSPVEGGFPVAFCGGGDQSACSALLKDSLKEALKVTPEQLYAFGACTSDPQPSCWNANRARVTAGVTKPNVYPYQNRPTFQQAVSVEKDLK